MTEREIAFTAIGTKWSIKVETALAATAWLSLVNRLHDRIEVFDRNYSRFRADSLVTQMAQTAGTYSLPADGLKLLDLYRRLYAATDGQVTPLIGQTMVQAGYDATYSLRKQAMRRPPRWEDCLSFTQSSLTLSRPALLDFGAAGKGYLVDILAGILEESGIESYLINAGGDIRQRAANDKAMAVGLENPHDTSEVLAVCDLLNDSLCASAGSKRQWADMHHIIDPISLQSPRQIMATWVIAADTMTADGLATALFFTEPQNLAQHFSFSYARLFADMSLESSQSFPLVAYEAARQ